MSSQKSFVNLLSFLQAHPWVVAEIQFAPVGGFRFRFTCMPPPKSGLQSRYWQRTVSLVDMNNFNFDRWFEDILQQAARRLWPDQEETETWEAERREWIRGCLASITDKEQP